MNSPLIQIKLYVIHFHLVVTITHLYAGKNHDPRFVIYQSPGFANAIRGLLAIFHITSMVEIVNV